MTTAAGSTPIDEACARVERAAEAIERALDPSPDRRQRLLDERAAALAVDAGTEALSSLVTLVFTRGPLRFAVDVRSVREVAVGCRAERLPSAPRVFAGVVELRGEILPVVSLEVVLGLPPVEPTASRFLVVLGSSVAELAVAADSVTAAGATPTDARWIDAALLLDDPRLRGDEVLP